ELVRRGVAALVSFGPAGNPAAITIRVGHRRHRIADRDATHGAPLGYNDARQIEAEDDGRRSPKEVELSKLVLQGVQGRGGNADQYLVGRRRTRTRTASRGSPARSLVYPTPTNVSGIFADCSMFPSFVGSSCSTVKCTSTP